MRGFHEQLVKPQPKKPGLTGRALCQELKTRAPVLSQGAVFLDCELRVSHQFSGTSTFQSCLHFSAGTTECETQKTVGAVFLPSKTDPARTHSAKGLGVLEELGDTGVASGGESRNPLPCLPIPAG